jgi:hypothetical protein
MLAGAARPSNPYGGPRAPRWRRLAPVRTSPTGARVGAGVVDAAAGGGHVSAVSGATYGGNAMREWVKLDTTPFTPETQETIRGGDVTVVISPYDVPNAVRGDYDERLKRFVIEFRYIGEEPWRLEKHDGTIALRIGKNSGRLYGIEVKAPPRNAETIPLSIQAIQGSIQKAIDTLGHRPTRYARKKNYQVAQDIITQYALLS